MPDLIIDKQGAVEMMRSLPVASFLPYHPSLDVSFDSDNIIDKFLGNYFKKGHAKTYQEAYTR